MSPWRLGRLIAEALGQLPDEYAEIDPAEYAEIAGVDLETLSRSLDQFAEADAPLAIPGSLPAGQRNGAANLQPFSHSTPLLFHAGKPELVFEAPEAKLGTNDLLIDA